MFMAHTPAVLTPFCRSDVFSKYLGVNIRLYHLAIIRVFDRSEGAGG